MSEEPSRTEGAFPARAAESARQLMRWAKQYWRRIKKKVDRLRPVAK